MLTSQDFKEIEKEANKIYINLEFEIIQEIAERIANVGYANTVALNNIEIAQEAGILYQDVINMVAKYNEASASQIKNIFETAGAKTIKSDDKIYRKAGLNPKGLSTSMLQLLDSIANKTHNNLSNLCMTTANTSQVQFYNAINKAYLETLTGVKSYSQAILDVVKDISNQGTYIEYPSGQHRSIEAATRMNILTGVNQTSGRLQLMRAEEMGWDLMELSAHSGARPEHAEWQGKIVSRSGKQGYLSLDDIGYGTATGFQGVNCRHTWFPYYEGSTHTYTDKELEDLKNETVTYNGQKISKYDATQIQRKMERTIRQNKKDIAMYQGILTSNNKDAKLLEDAKIKLANTQMKLKQNNSILNNFVTQTKFRKDNNRLFVNLPQKNITNIEQEDAIKKAFYKIYNNITDEKVPYLLNNLPNNKQINRILQNNNNLALIVKNNIQSIKIVNIKNKGVAHYDNKLKAIRFNLSKDIKNPKGKYTTLFHEVGHRVDAILKRTSHDINFKNAILNDTQNFINNICQQYNCNYENACKIISKNLKKSKAYSHSVSDIFSGATMGKIKGRYSHTNNYWKKNKYSIEQETFAHFFEATIRNDGRKIKDIQQIFPNAYNIFLKMF